MNALPTNSIIPVQRIRMSLQNRINYLRFATPDRVGWLLDAYYQGGFEIAKLWDTLERRNPTIQAVVGKRKADVGRMDYSILIGAGLPDEQQAEAQRHVEVLEEFYGGLRTSSALKQDESGGVGLLVKQILDAQGKEFSVHEWIWKLPRRGSGLTAEFRHCPLWWFENREGHLRYLTDDGQMYGQEMDPRGWLVSVNSTALMEATCVAWLFMHASLNDWVTFCEKFGMPGLLGKTSAPPNSPEWDALVTAVQQFGQDWAAVVNRDAEIGTVEAKGGSSVLPYPSLVEVMKRDIITLWRGGDLSTLSANQGQGQGASVQADETDLLKADDATFVSEQLNDRVDRAVIEYYFGEGTKPLAYFKLLTPSKQDVERDLKVDAFISSLGLPQRKSDIFERYSRTEPEAGDDIVIGRSAAGPADPPSQDTDQSQLGLANTVQLLNSAATAADEHAQADLRAAARDEIAAALGEALSPLRRRLAVIAEMTNTSEQRDALIALRVELPDFLRRAGNADVALAQALEGMLGAATANGLQSVPKS